MVGWIKVHRKLLISDMYQELTAVQRDILLQCLLAANHKPRKWTWKGEIFECKSGQFVTSLDSLKKLCAKGTSIRNVRTALVKLETWEFLTNESTKTGRLISVINWDTYQAEEEETDKATDKQVTKSRQRSDKQVTTNKNVKNVKNDKEENPLCSELKNSSQWPSEDLWLKGMIKGQTFFTNPQQVKLLDYSWWEDVDEIVSGINPEFIKKQFAEMRLWKKDNGQRWPTERGIRKFVKGWLTRAKEMERRKR